ncbi:polysaccharide deacetylase family protein [Clostridium sp. SHJSY1]|uniref:polysaccharide deacetylase family protein n=1 Tax=Clostridium sp. SHJSY1 TaxID=2942483 RepID=UPI0028760275|nr:polysaccharide deacetylase family protein [Clostridium sp. SHJSY1]MDS0526972.1 polysaccharide deacetylase family protein [Clostridium sp. SHJSY1]
MKKIFFVLVTILFLSIPYNCKAATNIKIPVMLYHVVSSNPSGQYQFSLTEFKKQMEYLKANGYTTLSIDQYYNIINKTASIPNKPVLLTFDDCTSDFYTNVYPILKQYNMKATEFVVTNWIDTMGHMTTNQIKLVSSNGIDIQNHTTNHSNITTLTHNQKYAAINDATNKIKSITNKASVYCAYPYGSYDTDTTSILKSLGYKTGFKVGGGLSTDTSDKYAMPRTMIINGDTLNVFIRKLSSGN